VYDIRRSRVFAVFALVLASALAFGQGTRIEAPDNDYKPEEDVKLGQEAADQVAREMPLLPENGGVDSYVESVGARLVDAIPREFDHPEFKYDFSVVNARDINAFALPGGPMFVNRGMIEAANSEGEMAGVMAHEISHVALRHGTAQASKSQNPGIQLGAIGGAILGAVIGGNAGEAIAAGTQLGLGAYLLKYSREYETQADILGAQILANAGYDPMDLARMFQTIEKQGGGRGIEWFSSHPNPDNRQQRISEEAKKLAVTPRRAARPREFTDAKADLKKMPPAPTMEEIAKSQQKEGSGGRYPENARIRTDVPEPSDKFRKFEARGRFALSVPENWRELGSNNSVTFAPEGAYGNHQGESVFTHGAIVGIAQAKTGDLEMASNQYIAGILQGNSYLRAEDDYDDEEIDGKDALRRRLSGKSSITNREEIVDVYTVMLEGNNLFYLVQVVPDNEQRRYRDAFEEMVDSVEFED
jgi:hypothetical protein